MDENCRTVWYWNGYRSNSWKRDTAKILLSVLALLLVFSLPYFGGFWYFYVYPASAKKSSLYHLYLLPSVGLGCRVFFPFNMSSILSSMLFICDFSGNFSLSSLPETGLRRLHRFHVFSTCPVSAPSRFTASCADWIPCFTRLEEKGLSLLPLLELDFLI